MPAKKRQKLYLETSAIGAYYEIKPKFMRDHTRKFWNKYLKRYQVYISEVTQKELHDYQGRDQAKLLRIIKGHNVLKVNNHVQKVTQAYIDNKIIHTSYLDDALHLAIVTVYKIDYLVSWNLKHLVKPEQQVKIKDFNSKLQLHIPIICTPTYFLTSNEL